MKIEFVAKIFVQFVKEMFFFVYCWSIKHYELLSFQEKVSDFVLHTYHGRA